jgi:hypothetical protein
MWCATDGGIPAGLVRGPLPKGWVGEVTLRWIPVRRPFPFYLTRCARWTVNEVEGRVHWPLRAPMTVSLSPGQRGAWCRPPLPPHRPTPEGSLRPLPPPDPTTAPPARTGPRRRLRRITTEWNLRAPDHGPRPTRRHLVDAAVARRHEAPTGIGARIAGCTWEQIGQANSGDRQTATQAGTLNTWRGAFSARRLRNPCRTRSGRS